MEIVLFILYAIALMLQIFLLGRAVKYPGSASWTDLYATEIISALAAFLLFLYYETLSGLHSTAYSSEAFCSLIAAAVFSGMLAISSMIGAARGAKEN